MRESLAEPTAHGSGRRVTVLAEYLDDVTAGYQDDGVPVRAYLVIGV